MIKLIIISIFFTASSLAKSKVKDLSLELRQIQSMRHAYYPEKTDWFSFVGLNWNVDTASGLFFWDNQVAFYGDRAQVRHIYWQYQAGIRLSPDIDLFWHHKSEHVADSNKDDIGHLSKFPIEDSIGLRINLK